jgi:DNA (cytosine-5)-methyltransferase 1/putative restriction endonuclease
MPGGWTREELFQALRLYFETPFGRLHNRNPDIISLAGRIGRSPSAVAMKLVNFASIDPQITESGRKGLSGASAGDRAAWAAFTEDWRAALDATIAPQAKAMDATEQAGWQTRRIGQNFFRNAVLSNFDNRCCATGLAEPRLLIASHIVPWAEDESNRLNPANGLCLAATVDRAFDAMMITLDEQSRWRISRHLRDHRDDITRSLFAELAGKPMAAPRKIAISGDQIARHRRQAAILHRFD